MLIKPRKWRQQYGVSLIEALIALVVLSAGMLGLASLQLNSLKFNQTASFRSKATGLAYDMLDRMRASATQANNGDFAYATLGSTQTSGSNFAQVQVNDWLAAIDSALPAGQGRICSASDPSAPLSCDGGPFFVVEVAWSEAQEVNAAMAQQSFLLVSRL